MWDVGWVVPADPEATSSARCSAQSRKRETPGCRRLSGTPHPRPLRRAQTHSFRAVARACCGTARISRGRSWLRPSPELPAAAWRGSAPGRQYAELVARTIGVHPPGQRTPAVVERPTAALPDPGRDLVRVVDGLEADVEV